MCIFCLLDMGNEQPEGSILGNDLLSALPERMNSRQTLYLVYPRMRAIRIRSDKPRILRWVLGSHL